MAHDPETGATSYVLVTVDPDASVTVPAESPLPYPDPAKQSWVFSRSEPQPRVVTLGPARASVG